MATLELKHDALGTIRLIDEPGTPIIERDTRTARRGAGWLARRLARREAAALSALEGTAGVPRLLAFDGYVLRRSHLPGAPLFAATRPSPVYFSRALRLLRALHRAGIVHNDLAKEANWLCAPGDVPGIVDFQVAVLSQRRGKWFRHLAYEDLRHLLKHKRTYQPQRLTARQKAVLAAPVLATRFWRGLWKPAYRALTRRVLGWPERAGPAERQG
jgi:RIO-like serine/threonine protein kinase